MADSQPEMHLRGLDFAAVGAYFLGLLLIGAIAARRQSSADMYFLGGRRVHWLLAGVSVVATLLSTLTYLAVPGEVIQHGIAMYTQLAAFVAIVPFVNYIVIPAVMRLPVTSVYDYLQRRFNRQMRTLGASIFVLTRVAWIGMILYTASFAISQMTGWSVPAILLVMGVVTTLYTTSGGLEAVIWSDFAQFLVLFGGAIVIPIYIAMQTDSGPILWWQTLADSGRTKITWFSFDPTLRVSAFGVILDIILWNVCTHLSDQVAVQRYLSTPSIKSARRSMWVYSIGNVGMIFLLALCGVAIFHFYSQQANSPAEFQHLIATQADKLMPLFMAQELPAGTTGLLLAALLAAAMSSISSGINSISTVISSDFLAMRETTSRPAMQSGAPAAAAAHDGVATARWLAGLTGSLGIVMALVVYGIMLSHPKWNLLEMVARLNHLCVAPLGALFLAGILLHRVGAAAALVGFLAGTATSFVVSFSTEIFQLAPGKHISFMWIMPCSFLVSLLVTYAAGFLLPAPSQEQLASLSSKREVS
jgi:SSS family solute:Na+ symporter